VDTVHECDRRTDGQTDRITITDTVHRIVSHGKNRDKMNPIASSIGIYSDGIWCLGPSYCTVLSPSTLVSTIFFRSVLSCFSCGTHWTAQSAPFLPRDAVLSAVYATPIPPVCGSVCLSVTRVDCIKTAEGIIEILSLSDRPIILVFRHQGLLHKSDGFNHNGAAKYRG